MTEMILIYVTCKNKAQAKKIGLHLLKKRLCACINVIPETHPAYLWPPKSGKIAEGKEALLLVKTLRDRYEDVEREVRKLHSYSIPAIFALPVLAVEQNFLNWLEGEVK